MVDSVVIVSGGLDSVTLLHHLVKAQGHDCAVMTFRYGQKHSREIECAIVQARALGIDQHEIVDLTAMQAVFASSALTNKAINIPTVDDVQGDPQPATYVPNRNMLFLAIAVAYAETLGASEVVYGAQKADMYGYWDTTAEFLDRLNQVYALNRKSPVRITAPFVDFSKADILREGQKLSVDYAHTWSCYRGTDKACGTCPTCAERLQAFAELGIPDPVPYD